MSHGTSRKGRVGKAGALFCILAQKKGHTGPFVHSALQRTLQWGDFSRHVRKARGFGRYLFGSLEEKGLERKRDREVEDQKTGREVEG